MVQAHMPLLELAQIQEARDQGQQVVTLAADRVDELALFFIEFAGESGGQHIGVADDRRQGGSQLVGHVADQIAAHGLRLLQLGGHLVEAQGELRQFVNIFVGSRNVRALEGLETRTAEGDVLAIIPAVAGGAS